jgi:hypothetical protein
MKLFYSIADLPICIETPYSLEISKESYPFLISEGTDCVERIELVPMKDLPPMEKAGIWHQDRYYTGTDAQEAIYIRSGPGEPPYAMLTYNEAHHVRLMYLRDSEDMVLESRYLMNMISLEQLLLRHDGLILHSSLVRWQGKGILFSAPSGTGKSTQASLWEKHMGAEILNGDRAGIRYVDGRWMAYGLPYAGSSRIYCNESAPIRAIVVLRQGPENVIHPMTPMAALRALLPEFSAHRWNSSFMNKVLDIVEEMLQVIPVFCLECRPDHGAVQLLHDTFVKEEMI